MAEHSIAAYDTLYSQFDMLKRPYGYPKGYVLWRSGHLRKPWMRYLQHDGGLMLDVGGGYGVTARFLPPQYPASRYINLDCSQEMLKYSPHRNILAVSEHLPLKNNTMEYIICSEALEHVSDVQATLSECHRVLKPRGWLFLSTPRTGWLRDWKKISFYRQLLSLYSHLPHPTLQPSPVGIIETSFSEAKLRPLLQTLFTIQKQYRGDTHVPWMSTSPFWRLFSTLFVNPQKYGHCAVFICRKEG